MSQPRNTRIPAPLYAVAGVGDVAYQQLRRLPEVVTGLSDPAARNELREKAVSTTAELREKAVTTTAELREKAATTLRNANTAGLRDRAARRDVELDRLREAAIRNAAVVVAGAQAAQERAFAVYGELVARGERVVGTGVVQAADTVNADMEATEAPAAVAATPTRAAEPTAEIPTPADVAEVIPTADDAAAPKRRPAAKSTRPAAKSTRPATKRTPRPTSGE
ncbi:hypothetical protein [Plantactinospora sp. CA-290183]|uniref:hypothetical protein n=1 Tax=Plantactinospora sp. CA-290183 TaxID=3240006 RepID=UPI003D8B7440